MKLLLLIAILTITIGIIISSPLSSPISMDLLSRMRRSHGSAPPAPAPVSKSQSQKIKIVSNVDNKSSAEASILDVDVGTGLGVDLGVNTSLANGVLAGGLSGEPLIGAGALNLGNILGGLLDGAGKAGKVLGAAPKKDVLDEIIADVEKSQQPVAPLAAVSVPASAAIGNPLGVNLGDIPPNLLDGLSNVLGTILDPTSAGTV